jgi:hypothetical protein
MDDKKREKERGKEREGKKFPFICWWKRRLKFQNGGLDFFFHGRF